MKVSCVVVKLSKLYPRVMRRVSEALEGERSSNRDLRRCRNWVASSCSTLRVSREVWTRERLKGFGQSLGRWEYFK